LELVRQNNDYFVLEGHNGEKPYYRHGTVEQDRGRNKMECRYRNKALFYPLFCLALIPFLKLLQLDRLVLNKTQSLSVSLKEWKSQEDQREGERSDETTTNTSIICQRISGSNNNYQSLMQLWGQLLPTFQEHILPAGLIARNPKISAYFEDTLQFLTWSKLKRSILHPPNPSSVSKILNILDAKLQNNSAPPLRIVVYGGSVTVGSDCGATPFGVILWRPNCAWPLLLEKLVNGLLLEKVPVPDDVVQIRNMGMGGTRSSSSAAMLEMGLWPKDYLPDVRPDIIVWSHAINDIYRGDSTLIFQEELQRFHLEARKARCDDEALPLIVYVNDQFGEGRGNNIAWQWTGISAVLGRLTAWYGAMGVSFDTIVGDYVYSRYEGDKTSLPLLGMLGLPMHPGLMFHAMMPIVLLFNALHAAYDVCEEQRLLPSQNTTRKYLSVGSSNQTTYHYEKMNIEELPIQDKPALTEDLAKGDIFRQWKLATEQRMAQCQKMPLGNPCSYAWLIGNALGITTTQDVTKIIERLVTSSTGWDVSEPKGQEKLGYTANRENSWFEARVPVVKKTVVKVLRLIIMKSYTLPWKDSTLRITVKVQRGNSTIGQQVHHVSGYNNLDKTSIIVPNKLEIPTAETGDVVHLKCELIKGKKFKIVGMALCER
jgi:hypothetical protein